MVTSREDAQSRVLVDQWVSSVGAVEEPTIFCLLSCDCDVCETCAEDSNPEVSGICEFNPAIPVIVSQLFPLRYQV
jgi:hypothetical protein